MVGWCWEEAQRFYAETPLRLWVGALLVGFVVELAFAAERGQPLRRKLFNLANGAIYLCAIFLIAPALSMLVATIVRSLAGGHLLLLDLSPHSNFFQELAAYLLWFLIIDFFYYWWHRMQHTVGWLWDQHTLHHTEEALNVSSNIRHHWTEFAFQSLVITLPVTILFDIPLRTSGILSVLLSTWPFFIHWNVRLPLGAFSPIIAGPQVHRLHHSRLPQHWNRNYAAYFPVWDVIFGTYVHPAPGEYPPTGLADGTRIDSVWLAATYPFACWLRKIKARLPASPVRNADAAPRNPDLTTAVQAYRATPPPGP
jgi:sterol desaturase/sphingolipid hydroxylase (fatty acid hydroxylase superfamily)